MGISPAGFNLPGVLLSASVSSSGSASRIFGTLYYGVEKTGTGAYKITHKIPHTNYTVMITPNSSGRLSWVSTKTAYTGAAGSGYVLVFLTTTSPTQIDTAFDFIIAGSN